MRFPKPAALLVLLAAAATAALPAAADRSLLEQLPRTWCGTFGWERYRDTQYVTIAFDRLERRADGTIEAHGRGLVRTWRTVPFLAHAVIHPATRRIEIFEEVPKPTPGYITDGSHVGEIAADLQSMRLVWTTRGTGERGAMDLAARPAGADPSQPCGVPSS